MRDKRRHSLHAVYGVRKPRINYVESDFVDYAAMIALSALTIKLSYGVAHILCRVGLALCALMLATFVVRHGVELNIPVILKRPQDLVHMLTYKLRNLTPIYFIAVAVLVLENVLISATPNLPHRVELMRTIGFYLFYAHLICITVYRTAILVDHLAKKELVREVLLQTPWKRALHERTSITLEILHAFCTGLLTHIILIAPWYLVISYSSFSVVFFPLVCLINVVVHRKWFEVVNVWYYRDHWLGHNSELEFVYLHGTHHDAIPSGMIGVAGNGLLEGFLRYTIGWPSSFYNPVVSFIIISAGVRIDIDGHQYIPGVLPRLSRSLKELNQHSTHHYGALAPYGLAMKMDQPDVPEEVRKIVNLYPSQLRNTIELDEELTGFKWDNPFQRKLLSLYDKYQKR